VPLRIIPDRRQVPEDARKEGSTLSAEESGDVFDNDGTWLEPSNHVKHIWPHPSIITSSSSHTSDADGLTRRPAAYDVDARHARPVHRADVAQILHARPMAREHGARVRLDLRLPHDAHPRALEAKVDPSDP
jgi:hypothetical protein